MPAPEMLCVRISIHALREEGDYHAAAAIHLGIEFLSTPSARRATVRRPQGVGFFGISIHALREEGDIFSLIFRPPILHISIHALREEGDDSILPRQICGLKFLSTPSARRATETEINCSAVLVFLSTPSARRATMTWKQVISSTLFLSTPSARRATVRER